MKAEQFHDETKKAAQDGRGLASALNGADDGWLGPQQKDEIKFLLSLIRGFQEKAAGRIPIPPEDIQKVNKILHPYTWRVELLDVIPGLPRKGSSKTPIAYLAWANSPTDSFSIGHLTKSVVTLARLRLLDRVRQCPHCARWFYAKYRGKKHCTPACQIAAWRKTDQGKESTKAAQKRHYKKWSSELEEFRSWKKKQSTERKRRKS